MSSVTRFGQGQTSLVVNHQGVLVSNTISFNLAPGVSLSTAMTKIEETMNLIGVPGTIRGLSQGAAKIFQESLSSEPFLVLAAFATIYISLGMLYESFVHPLPSCPRCPRPASARFWR